MEKQNALAPQKDETTGRFLPGNTGFGGRPIGARNKLGEAFIEALHESFQEQGVMAIQKVIDDKPDQYLKIIASLLPKDVNLNVNKDGELTDDELLERIRALSETIAPFLGRTGAAVEGGKEARVKTIAPRVH